MHIDTDRELVTLVVTFQIDPAQVDAKIEHLREVGREHSGRPGFVSCSIHKSPDDSTLIEYIQWESMEAFQAVLATFKDGSPHPPDFAISATPTMLEVVEVIEPSS